MGSTGCVYLFMHVCVSACVHVKGRVKEKEARDLRGSEGHGGVEGRKGNGEKTMQFHFQ